MLKYSDEIQPCPPAPPDPLSSQQFAKFSSADNSTLITWYAQCTYQHVCSPQMVLNLKLFYLKTQPDVAVCPASSILQAALWSNILLTNPAVKYCVTKELDHGFSSCPYEYHSSSQHEAKQQNKSHQNGFRSGKHIHHPPLTYTGYKSYRLPLQIFVEHISYVICI